MEKRILVFATNNRHKLEEVQQILGNDFHVKGLKDIGCNEDIEEYGKTLKENAAIKARWIYEHYGFDCFADDTGLEVDSLNGAPGVYSARYAGEDASFEDNNQKLLQELKNVTNRKARFRTVICLIQKGVEHFFEGEVQGRIAASYCGHDGFGYDPIFIPENSNLSFAQMSSEEKNAISHRGRATQKFVDFIL